MNTHQKKNPSNVILRQTYWEYKYYYIDRSKMKDRVGAPIISGLQSRNRALFRNAYIFATELHALSLACEWIKDTTTRGEGSDIYQLQTCNKKSTRQVLK